MLGCGTDAGSPTFGIINEYTTATGRLVCHTDWYRIRSLEELLDTGITEYMDNPDFLLLVEWPDIGAPLTHGEQVLKIEIQHLGDRRSYRIADA